jgi:hypothetical protein
MMKMGTIARKLAHEKSKQFPDKHKITSLEKQLVSFDYKACELSGDIYDIPQHGQRFGYRCHSFKKWGREL